VYTLVVGPNTPLPAGADVVQMKAFDLCLYLLSSVMADNTRLQFSNDRLEQQLAVVNSHLQSLQQQQRLQQDLERRDEDIINALDQLQLGTSTLLAQINEFFFDFFLTQ
jgi:hypothetical protein